MIEERAETRFNKALTVFIEGQSSSYDGSSTADIVICKSVDLSSDGLQVAVDKLVPRNKVLRLCLDVKGKPPIFVVGEVMWQRREAQGYYRLGIRLFDSDGTDYAAWQQAISDQRT